MFVYTAIRIYVHAEHAAIGRVKVYKFNQVVVAGLLIITQLQCVYCMQCMSIYLRIYMYTYEIVFKVLLNFN